MEKSPFIHLHVHSHYSMLQALPKLPELVSAAKEQGMDALALTDYGAMYGPIEFIHECQEQGIKPIIGQCAYMALDKHTDKRPRIDDKQHQLVLLAETLEGYKNLLKLTTIAHLEGFYYRPRIDKDLLRVHGKGLIGLSGGSRGEICKALSMDDWERAEAVTREFMDIFGEGNFFLELQDHDTLDEQNARNQDLIKLSEMTGCPVVATKDVHYIKPADAEAHDVLTCIGAGKTINDERRRSMTDADYSFASAEHMQKAFAHAPQAVENTRKIADRCSFEIPLGKWEFADFKIPDGYTYDEFLRKEAYEGIEKKVPEVTQVMKDRIDYELDIIKTKGYAPYFLIVSDYMRHAKRIKVATTTRGSAAGSLVSYATDIVPVNPLDYKLPFERFLNPLRPSAPDVDGDFEDSRRDEMIAYVTEKYGKDKVAQIGTYGTMAAKGSVRDVGRALGYEYAFCDKVAKLIPMGAQGFPMTIARALEETPELKELHDTDPDVRKLLAMAQQIEGNARHVSVHAAGVVIAPRPLTEYTALQLEAGGDRLITQYDMRAVEDAGVLKMDFLGIRNLSILGHAVNTIKRTKGIEVDLEKIPLNDGKTFELLTDGETVGLFQLGGSGMTKWLKELGPTTITDVMAMVALFRPGPMESIPEFIARKKDPSRIVYPDPRLKEVLKESYGVITYQDDVLLTAITIAGYDWLDADKLRKAMGKKIPEVMRAEKGKFLKGCVEHGKVTEQKAQELWSLIEPFAAYGFNKAHAAAYGLVAYQTAYLKANWPVEYMSAVLTAESGDLDTVAEVSAECVRMGIEVLPPSVNESLSDFTYIDDKTIRFGLRAIKNVGTDIAQAIIDEREAHGPYVSVGDFAARIDSKNFNKRGIEALIKAGALDQIGERNQLLASIDQVLAHHKNAMKRRESGQESLFSGGPSAETVQEVALREVPPATKREKLAWERELLGLYVSSHPYADYRKYFDGMLVPLAKFLEQKGHVGLVRVGGIISDCREILTKKKQEPMAFVKLEDGEGEIEVVVFPRTYAESKGVWQKDNVVMIEGKFDERDGAAQMICERGTTLTTENIEEVRRMLSVENKEAKVRTDVNIASERVRIAVPPAIKPAIAEELKRIIAKHPGGRRVVLIVDENGGKKQIETSMTVAIDGDCVAAIEKLFGRGAVKA